MKHLAKGITRNAKPEFGLKYLESSIANIALSFNFEHPLSLTPKHIQG
jgi:hypothetical protein